jgi:hypothetical protein
VQVRDRDRAVASRRERRIVGVVVTVAMRHWQTWMRVWVFVLFRHRCSLQSRQQRAAEGDE